MDRASELPGSVGLCMVLRTGAAMKVCPLQLCPWCMMKVKHDDWDALRVVYEERSMDHGTSLDPAFEQNVMNCLVQTLLQQRQLRTGEAPEWLWRTINVTGGVAPPPPPPQNAMGSAAAAERHPEPGDADGAPAAGVWSSDDAWVDSAGVGESSWTGHPPEQTYQEYLASLLDMPPPEWRDMLRDSPVARLTPGLRYVVKFKGSKKQGWVPVSAAAMLRYGKVFTRPPFRTQELWAADEHKTQRMYQVFFTGDWDGYQYNTQSYNWRPLKVCPSELPDVGFTLEEVNAFGREPRRQVAAANRGAPGPATPPGIPAAAAAAAATTAGDEDDDDWGNWAAK